MKTILVVLAMFACAGLACADEYVRGYTRKDGTYVAPHVRSSPDNSYNNNQNVNGNYNPNTNQYGTDRPTYNDRTPEYNQKTTGDSGYSPAVPYNSNLWSGNKKKY